MRDVRFILIGLAISLATFCTYWLVGPRRHVPATADEPEFNRIDDFDEPADPTPAPAQPERTVTPLRRPAAPSVHPIDANRVRYPFLPAPDDPYRSPTLVPLSIPDFAGSFAIWGATGRDANGHVWFGVSAHDVPIPSARLFEFLPDSKKLIDRGNVVAELVRSRLFRDGEGQMKIHSRITQAADGYLYFASMDEQGEQTDGSRLPTWGGHLWRLNPAGGDWEHLLATPEALIAVANGGQFIYALGYFGHVLYQFDCGTGDVRRVEVGAIGGHISRNFAANEDGHAFVPRLRASPADPTVIISTLVEFDSALREIAELPIQHYTATFGDDSHGIVALEHLADRSIVIATDQGYLYRIVSQPSQPSALDDLGWFHPKGAAYVASMFSGDGAQYLMGASRRANETKYEWLVYDLARRSATAIPLNVPGIVPSPANELLLYGSMTRDDSGNYYLAGTYTRDGQSRPVIFQVRP